MQLGRTEAWVSVEMKHLREAIMAQVADTRQRSKRERGEGTRPESMARRWPVLKHGFLAGTADAARRDGNGTPAYSVLDRPADGRMKSTGYSKRKNAARKAARAARRRNRR